MEPIPVGARVEKCNSEPTDMHPDGSPGTVVNRLGPHPDDGSYGYFVRVR